MFTRFRRFYRRHKIAATLGLIIGLPVGLVALYCGLIISRAYLDTPRVVAEATSAGKISLRLQDMSEDYRQILLTVEDPNFYSHHGIDVTTPGAGWTTITQGIVKVYFYNGFTPGVFRYRKIEQSLIAWVFNSRVDKQTQLLIFINSAYFGNNASLEVVGFDNAAAAYFQKKFSDLARDEYIALVAMLVGPNEFNVRYQPEKNAERVKRIKNLLSGGCRPTRLSDVYFEACG
jgi:membrane carboxypeptidase/penicillin-binding protein